MPRHFLFAAGCVLACLNQTNGQDGTIFVSRPGQIVKLIDRNGDGDFLDFAETTVYAESLPTSLGAIVWRGNELFVVNPAGGRVFVVRDLNTDGDAFEYGEVMLYAELPASGGTPVAAALACRGDGTLFVANAVAGTLYAFMDRNGDGDALDVGETTLVALGLTGPTAIALRPDARLLLAQNSFNVPVRILSDRDGDGDYMGFAENISYAEELTPGQDLSAPLDRLAYLTRPAGGSVLRLCDRTKDDDVLDYGEVVVYAEGLPSPFAIAAVSSVNLLVACRDSAGSVYRLLDRNGDGDALDYGEALAVAVGVNDPGGIAWAAGQECRKGDITGNGVVDVNDVLPFVQILVGSVTPEAFCPADANSDGLINGDDIQQFVATLLP